MTTTIHLTNSRSQVAPGAAAVLRIAVTAPTRNDDGQHRLPLDLAIALDVSGSMRNSKLEHAKHAAIRLVSRLAEQDTCALVTFGSTSTVHQTSTTMHAAGRDLLIDEIKRLTANGNTALHAGWSDAVKTLSYPGEQRHSLRRVFLLTDGEANHGITDAPTLARLAGEAQASGITTTTFGIGEGYNEQLLSAMASAGEGNTYYIQEPAQVDTFFGQELAELFTVTLRDASLAIHIPAGVTADVVGDRNHRRTDDTLHIPLGSLMSGEIREIYVHYQLAPTALAPVLDWQVVLSGTPEGGMHGTQTGACVVPVGSGAPTIDEPLEAAAAAVDVAAALAAALASLRGRNRSAALAIFSDRATRFPLFARFGGYQSEAAKLPQWDDNDGMKRRSMYAKDMVSSTPGVVEKYEYLLELLIERNAPAEEIDRVRDQLESFRQRHRRTR